MRLLIVAPHPDDETLGAGGTLLRRRAEGWELGWLIVTGMSEGYGWPAERVSKRAEEISQVSASYGFKQVFELGLPPARLDELAMGDIVSEVSRCIRDFEPNELYLPSRGDAHTDHRIVFDVVAACTKWFRYPSIERALAYETLSETDFGLVRAHSFHPNLFIEISNFINKKIEIMQIFQSEILAHPFPRSEDAIRALATLRGARAGYQAAEAFELLMARS